MILHVDSQYLSPYALSAYVALRTKGIDFSIAPVDLAAGEQRSRDYAERSITRRVPTLVADGFALSESSAIAEFLEDTVGGARLYPADARERARARQVQAWLRSDLADLRRVRPTDVVFCRPSTTPLDGAAQAAADRLVQAATALLPEGRTQLFEAWSIADVDLALMLRRLQANDDPIPDALVRYVDRQWAHPHVQAWVSLPRRS